jgi:NTP pyrophosphatase (non-canonical NTP hydrolase)
VGYLTDGLSFNTLRGANEARLPEFKNNKGETAHAKEDGSDWSPNDWMTALTGEVGEAANVLKKVRRGDLTIEEARPMLTQELADVCIYLDLLAKQVGVNLGDAVIATFNTKSKKVGSRVYIGSSDWHYRNTETETQHGIS